MSTKECCLTSRGSNPRQPDYQSDAKPTEPPRPAEIRKRNRWPCFLGFGTWVLSAVGILLKMSYCDLFPSVVRRRPSVVRPSTLLNDFSSENPGPIFFKLHVEPSVKEVLKICSNGHGPLIKIAAIPIYGKILKNLLLQNQESFKVQSWYIASWTQGLLNLSK